MIDATSLKAHRTACSLLARNGPWTPNRPQFEDQDIVRGTVSLRTGGMNTKLHAICDSQGRPRDLFIPAGQVSDYIGARALLSGLPSVKWLLGDRDYGADRLALQDKGINACIPGRRQRTMPIKYDKRRYKR